MTKNIFIAISLIIIFMLGIINARILGENKGLSEINQIYLMAACADKVGFKQILEAYDLSELGIRPEKLESVRKDWINSHLLLCDN